MKIVRAMRWVTNRCPKLGRSRSICCAMDPGPSMSESMIGFHWSSRYWVRSVLTVVASSGTLPGRISGEVSLDAHSSCTIEDTSLSTPRVRWNRSSVDQSSYRRSSNSGCSG